MDFGCDERDMRRAWKKAARAGRKMSREFGRHGGFGPEGPFGPKGPFGPDGPFGPSGPFGPGGPFGDGGGGGRRRRGRMFDRAELRLALLKLIAEEPRHGYDLIKAMEELTAGEYAPSPGVIYPTLQMMVDEGVIAELPDDTSRKVFEATEAGRAELANESETVEALFERLAHVGERVHSAPNRQLHRAMENLRNAMRHQRGALREGREDMLEKIVDVLDEAARKIERL